MRPPYVPRILQVIAISMLLGKTMSPVLWQSDRLFPLVPLVPGLDQLPLLVHQGLYFGHLLAWALLLFFPPDRNRVLLAVGLELVLFTLDINRVQPWAWLNLVLLLPFIIQPLCLTEDKRFGSWLLIILGLFYCWAGIHKFNGEFVTGIYLVILKLLFGIEKGYLVEEGRWLAYGIPVIELAAGVCLLLPRVRLRWLGWALMLGSHLFIIYMVLPGNASQNHVVIPWNIELPILGFLALKAAGDVWPVMSGLSCRAVAIAVVFFQILLPLGYYLDLTSDYIAYSLYSGKQQRLLIWFPDSAKIPQELRTLTEDPSNLAPNQINTTRWSLQELGVPHPASTRIYKAVGARVCEDWQVPYARFTLVKSPHETVGPVGCEEVKAGQVAR